MKISTQIFITLFSFFLGMSHLAAKEIGQITGNIKDEAGIAVPFVNISLIDATSATLLTGAVSDVGGMYNGIFGPNTGISLNIKKGKWTNNASLNYNEFNFNNELNISRNFQLEEGTSNNYGKYIFHQNLRR